MAAPQFPLAKEVSKLIFVGQNYSKPLLTVVVVFSVAAGVQLCYHLFFLTALRKLRSHKHVVADSSEPVSVIVCAHDEEENLRELVPVLLQQDYDTFEIIVVNDRSNDNTYDFLRDLTSRDNRVRMVDVKHTPDHVNSKKFALTLGIRAASYEWLVLTDADCRPSSDKWIRNLSVKFRKETDFVIGFSPYQEQASFLNKFIRFESLITAIQYLSFALKNNPFMGVGRNLAYRKSLFLEKKGFNNFLGVTGGDDDLFVNQHARKGNTAVVVSADSVVYSIPEKTWSGFTIQKIRHLSVGKFYRSKHKLALGLFHISWILTLFVGLALIPFYQYYYAIIAVLIIRWLIVIFNVRSLVLSAGLRFNLPSIPLLDFLFPFYYISTGLVTLFTKKVRWKTT